MIMVNRWVQHVKQFARDNNMAYGCALADPKCSQTYRSDRARAGMRRAMGAQYKEPLPPPPPRVFLTYTGRPRR
jgi:hypothetical protein